jgi:hypothetical protein
MQALYPLAHLPCHNEPENRRPDGCSQCGPGGNDRAKSGSMCTLVVYAGVLFVYIWCIRRGIV